MRIKIRGFPKFVEDERSRPCTLKDCSVVIDGQNFFYYSYLKSQLPYVFGSEANQHAKYLVREKLNMFKEANVKCYVLFRGGTRIMDEKIPNLYTTKFDFESNYEYAAPVFLEDVCKQVLEEEENVNYATCITESKDDCVALAERLGCSVLSNDMSYCFRRVPYIPYNTLESSLDGGGITCKQYDIKHFLKKYKLTERKLAIFVSMSDRSVFKEYYFSDLFNKWRVSNKNLNQQCKNLFKWLSERSEAIIKNQILGFLKTDADKKKFEDHIKNVLGYMSNDYNSIACDYLYEDLRPLVTHHDPLWFEKGVAAQYIAVPYINMYKHKYIPGSRAIETKDSIDSIMLSIDIIKYAYNLLNNFVTAPISVYQNAGNFTIEDSGDTIITKPEYECDNVVFENGWENLRNLGLFEHFLVQNGIDISLIDEFSEEARMLFIALIYFARKKSSMNINVTKHVNCFIICYVLLHEVFDESIITREDAAEAIRVTERYFTYNKDEAKEIFDGDELKTLAELQYCLLHMNYLNALCGKPYTITKYHKTFNGTFVYKLLNDMQKHGDNNLIESLFKQAPSVLNFINSLITTYNKGL